jgi:hypothetical protein
MSFTKIVSLAPSFIILFIIHCIIILKACLCPTTTSFETELTFMCESILNSILRKLMTERLKLLSTKIVPTLCEEPQFNKYQVPRIEKMFINRGLGDASQNAKILQSSLDELYYCRSTWRFDPIKKKQLLLLN